MDSRHHQPASTLAWIITIVTALVVLTKDLMPAGVAGLGYLFAQTVLLTTFTLLHGARRYGWRAIGAYYVITLVVSNAFENTSVVTGFPFGHYHYTTGPHLFLVPVTIGPAYAAVGYLAWTIAALLVGDVRRGSRLLPTVGTPVVGSFAMVAWDLAMDPTRSTIQRFWIWEHAGGFFGVPLGNFIGWSLTTYAFLQLFAWYLRMFGPPPPAVEPGVSSHAQPLVVYTAIAGTFVMDFLTGQRAVVTDAVGRAWRTGDIYETSVLITLYGMAFLVVLAVLTLAGRHTAARTRHDDAASEPVPARHRRRPRDRRIGAAPS